MLFFVAVTTVDTEYHWVEISLGMEVCEGCAPRVWSQLCEFCSAGVGLVVCVTSCEGHMVDALASRADEGRRSLR